MDVRSGLTGNGQKQLPAKYLYDAVGSALFDVITLLPEYGLTRADVRLIETHIKDVARFIQPSVVIELGSGGGEKSRRILQVLSTRNFIEYCPIDVSAAALRHCERQLSDLAGVKIHAIEDSYIEGLETALRRRQPGTSALVLFLGSSIGNLDHAEAEVFCMAIRQRLGMNDMFLISTDLEQDESRMLAAYDDPLGVTASFNRNVLARINRELQGNFVLDRFEHRVRYDKRHRRIEMHLHSRVEQTVSIGDMSVGFRKGETIWTESSHKFRCEDVLRMAEVSGFHTEAQWLDEEWPFAQTLLSAG